MLVHCVKAAAFFLVLLGGAGCVRGVLPEGEGAASLVGSTAPLLPNPSLRLAVAGAVGERRAEIEFDVTSSLTVITTGCLDEPEVQAAEARLADPVNEKDAVYPVTKVRGLRVGSVRLRALDVGLLSNRRCVVILGLDVLGGLSMNVKVATRRVTFLPSRPLKEWRLVQAKPNADSMVLELTRDPTHDWPLLPVRVHQGPVSMTATFVFSTRERFSRTFDAPARAHGLRPGLEVLHELSKQALPGELEGFTGFPYEVLELAPQFGVTSGTLDVIAGEAPHGIAGVLAVDVWGRFDVTYDVKAAVLALSQPKLKRAESGHRFVCARGDEAASEMNCFELHSEKTAEGLNTVVTTWQPLETGARLYLDVVGPNALPCRVGVTFSEGDRGRSAQHLLPWARLATVMPGCSVALAAATEVKLGLFDEGPLLECPGVCGFVQDLRNQRVSCECQPKSGGTGSESERTFFELYRKLLGPSLPSPDVEPSDPE